MSEQTSERTDKRRIGVDDLHAVITTGILTEPMREYVALQERVELVPSARTQEVQRKISGLHADILRSSIDVSRSSEHPVYNGAEKRVYAPVVISVMGRAAMHEAVQLERHEAATGERVEHIQDITAESDSGPAPDDPTDQNEPRL